MSKQARFRSWVLASVILSAAGGCAKQDEGERCDLGNGNLDCQSGLLCRQITNQPYSLCCPPADQTPSVAVCSNVGGGGVAPVDASAPASDAGISSADGDLVEASEEDGGTDAQASDDAPEGGGAS